MVDEGTTLNEGTSTNKDIEKDVKTKEELGKSSETTNELKSKEEIDKYIQSKIDQVITKYSKSLKDKDKEIETLKTEKMTEEEKKQFELEQKEKLIEEKEKAFKRKELELKTIDFLKESEMSIDFRDYVLGNDEEHTKERIMNFKKLWDSEVKRIIENKFKDNGRTPATSGDSLTLEQIKNMKPEEINANWSAISKILEGN